MSPCSNVLTFKRWNVKPPPLPVCGLSVHDERAHFDGAHARRWDSAGDFDRFIEILRIDQVKAAELLLGLREGAIGGQALSIANAHRCCGRDRLQLVTGQVISLVLDI